MAKTSKSATTEPSSRREANSSSTITTRGAESTNIGASSFPINRKFNGTLIAPNLSVAKMTCANSGRLSIITPTRSPLPTPRAAKPRANASVIASTCAHVCDVSPKTMACCCGRVFPQYRVRSAKFMSSPRDRLGRGGMHPHSRPVRQVRSGSNHTIYAVLFFPALLRRPHRRGCDHAHDFLSKPNINRYQLPGNSQLFCQQTETRQ